MLAEKSNLSDEEALKFGRLLVANANVLFFSWLGRNFKNI